MHLIIGAGSVGTTLAAYLKKAGESVDLYVKPERLTSYTDISSSLTPCTTLDYVYLNKIKTFPAPRIVDEICLDGIQYIYLATKHYSLKNALALLPERLPETITLVPCMNGISASKVIRNRFPDSKIIPITVMFNAKWRSPLNVEITTKPQLYFPHDDSKLVNIFRRSGLPTKPGSESLEWGKLLINLNNPICTLTHCTFIDAFTDIHLRRVFVAMLDEATTVLAQAGVQYRLPMPIPYKLFRLFLLHARVLPWALTKVIPKSRNRAYPSMARDIENNLTTEIDQINGEIIALGKQLKITTPVNFKVVSALKKLEHSQSKEYISSSALSALVLS